MYTDKYTVKCCGSLAEVSLCVIIENLFLMMNNDPLLNVSH